MTDFPPDLPPGWYNPAHRVPRRDQIVRILMRSGVDHRAQFVVAHTDAWPSGASWLVLGGQTSLPFADVVSWSPDPNTPPPKPKPRAPKASEHALNGVRPAILTEVLIEVERTGTLLRLLPPDQLDWSPHPDIPSLRTLSWRLVRLVARIGWILDLGRVDVQFEPATLGDDDLQSPEGILEAYVANEEAVRQAVESLTAASMRAPWQLEREGHTVAHLPRGDALRTFGLTPLVYHRGELGLLLTALGVGTPHSSPLWPFAAPSPESAGN